MWVKGRSGVDGNVNERAGRMTEMTGWMGKKLVRGPEIATPAGTVSITGVFLFYFKESLIAFMIILFRIWRWTAAPGVTRWPLSSTRASPCPPHSIYIYVINAANASHHFSSPKPTPLYAPCHPPPKGTLADVLRSAGSNHRTHTTTPPIFQSPKDTAVTGLCPLPCIPVLSTPSKTTLDAPAPWDILGILV